MTKIKDFILIVINYAYFLGGMYILVGCGDENKNEEPSFCKSTIVYMMAENSLSYQTSRDIDEMIDASKGIPDNCCLLVYVDGSGNMDEESLPRLIRIHNGKAETICMFPEHNSCSGEVFTWVIKKISKDFPSKSYSLVMWSHGTGWVPQPHYTIGIDNNINDYSNNGYEMMLPEMRVALENTGQHFEWILFDACFMQCVEVAYELRNLADYIIGSPAEIPTTGAPYDKIVSSFFIEDSRKSAFTIAQGYYDYYKDNKGLVISVVDTSMIEILAMATSTVIPEIHEVGENEGVQQYGPWSYKSLWRPEYYDMASIMGHELNSLGYEYWCERMELAVPLRLYTEEWTTLFDFNATINDFGHLACMSMFIPARRYEPYGHNTSIMQTQWWHDVCHDRRGV